MFVSVRDYASRHGLSLNTVYKKIRKNRIQGKKEKGQLFVWDE